MILDTANHINTTIPVVVSSMNNTTNSSVANSNNTNSMIYIFSVIMLVGLCGNTRVVQLLLMSNKSPKRQKGVAAQMMVKKTASNTGTVVTNIFILNLAIADLFIMLLLPVLIFRMALGQWTLGAILCKMYFTFDGVNKFVSVAFIVLLSFDRYLAVCHPIWSRTVRTRNLALTLAACAWILVLFLMIPVFLFARLYGNEEESSTANTQNDSLTLASTPSASNVQCTIYFESSSFDYNYDYEEALYNNLNGASANGTVGPPIALTTTTSMVGYGSTLTWNHVFTLYNFGLNYLLPLVAISVFYLMIIYRLKNRDKQHRSTGPIKDIRNRNRNPNRQPQRSSQRTTVLILLIVLTYTICWLPYWVLQLGVQFKYEMFEFLGDTHFQMFSMTAYALQMTNSALNPYFYLFSRMGKNKQGHADNINDPARKPMKSAAVNSTVIAMATVDDRRFPKHMSKTVSLNSSRPSLYDGSNNELHQMALTDGQSEHKL